MNSQLQKEGDNMETVYTFEKIGRSLGVTAEQVKRLVELQGLPTVFTANDRTYSKYHRRIREADLLKFFDCNSMDEFRQLRYR